MKNCKCLIYIGMGAALTIMVQRYGKGMMSLVDKMMQKKCELIEDGLDLE